MITTGNINVWVVVGTSWKNSEIIIKLNVNWRTQNIYVTDSFADLPS
jgi:hypothetical protein